MKTLASIYAAIGAAALASSSAFAALEFKFGDATLRFSDNGAVESLVAAGVERVVPAAEAFTLQLLDGKGELYIDGEVVPLVAGDWFRIDPAGHRAIRAAADCGIKYLCIQTKRGSLEAFTANDGALCPDKAPWHK